MKGNNYKLKSAVVFSASVLAIASVAVIQGNDVLKLLNATVIGTAYAAGGHEGGRGGGGGHDGGHDSGSHDSGHESGGPRGAGAHQGGTGGRDKAAAQPYRGGRTTIVDLLADDDEDSHRPPWAGKKGGDSHSDEGHTDDSHSDSGHEH